MKFKINVLIICLYMLSIGVYLVQLVFGIENLNTYVTFGAELMLFAITAEFLVKNSMQSNFFFGFILISTISYWKSSESLIGHFNGVRESLPIFLLFVLLYEIYISNFFHELNRKFKQFSIIFLLVQIPVSILQFCQFGPGDAVGGTFGTGGSGLLTFTIFFLVFYLLESKIRFLTSVKKIKNGFIYLFFFIPIALNETKISFILFLLFFLSFVDFNKIGSSLAVIIFAVLTVISFSFIYSTQEDVGYNNPLDGIFNEKFLENYLLGDDRESEYEDMPRFSKLMIGVRILDRDDSLFFGKEYGAFKGTQLQTNSDFSKKNVWLLRGSRPYAFFLLISGGIAFLSLMIFMFLFEIFGKITLEIKTYSPPLLFFLTSCFFILLFYNDGLRTLPFSFIFINMIFYSKYYRIKRNKSIT